MYVYNDEGLDNIVEKRQNADNKHFFPPFSTLFQKLSLGS